MSLKTSHLRFSYNQANSWVFPDIDLAEGENLLILGNSGKGKTTLLHLLSGLLKPDDGNISIGQQKITSLSKKKCEQFRARHIGIVFQRSFFVKSLCVQDNLLLAQKLAGTKENPETVRRLLQDMGLESKLNELPGKLSVGEQQRVSIARATLNDPKVIFADEPTSALDDENTERVIELLAKTARRCAANLVVVTHDARLKDRFEQQIQL